MNKVIAIKQHQIQKLCEQFCVKELYLFGSGTTDNFNEQSDIDLLVAFKSLSPEEYAECYFNLHYALESLFGRQIDLLTVNSLSNPFFIKNINEQKELLYAA